MGLGFRGIAMPLLVFALATLPTAQADLSPPLPPTGVQAAATDAGTWVTWTPPPRGEPVLAYHVLRLDAAAAGWHEVGATDGSTASFLDATPPDVAAYSVTAESADGPSAMSAPAAAWSRCSLVGIAGTPPQPVVNDDCLWGLLGAFVRGTGPTLACGTVGASGPDWGCMTDGALAGDDPASDALGDLCAIVVVAGTPPQVGINWDCVGILGEPRLLVRG